MPKLRVKEILAQIDDEYLKQVEEETQVNLQVSKMTWIVMFKLLIMSLLSPEDITLRTLKKIYSDQEFIELTGKANDKTTRWTIWHRLNKMNPNFFKKIFEDLSKKYSDYLNKVLVKNKILIEKIDSTLVWLSEKLLNFWMKAGSPKERHIKFTVWLKWYIPTKVNVYTSQNASSEDIALWETILEETKNKNEVIVFDRWVQKRETYSKLIDKEIDFVTRLKNNAKCEVIRTHKEVKWRKAWELVLESDEIVKLFWKKWKKMDKELRRIVTYKWTEKYVFLTNILELNAREITEIYARRWDIEVFFKFIKQEFWFSHFVSRSENWIMNMLYITLIVAILIIVYKEVNKIPWYKEARDMFVAELKELLLIDLTIALWWDIKLLKKRYLYYYRDD